MTEAQTDYRTGANGLAPIETEQVEPQAGALELKRIIEDLQAGQEPDQADVDAAQAAFTRGGGYERADALAQAWAQLGNDPAQAWELIAPLLVAPLRPSVERVDDWDAVDAPPREWLIYGWLPVGRVGMFSGKGGKGKTWLLLQLAAAMAARQSEWLGRAPELNKPAPLSIDPGNFGPVVFASWEDEAAEFKRRLRDMDKTPDHGGEALSIFERMKDADGSTRFRFLDLSRRGPVWGVEEGDLYNQRADLLDAGKTVREYCEGISARLLILDSLGYAYGPDDSGNEGVAQFMADWDGWGRDNRCAVLLIHHPPKNPKPDDPAYRGASSWDAHARFRWELVDDNRDGQDPKLTARISSEKSSYAMPPDPVYLERSADTGWAWKASKDQKPTPANTGQCQGKNAKGQPCGNKATAGGYCKQHQDQAVTENADDPRRRKVTNEV